MLCVSLAERTVASLLGALRGVRFAEVRLDALDDLTEDGVRAIFSRSAPLVATFRPGRRGGSGRLGWLALAIESGAAYVDIELGTPAAGRDRLISLARRTSCRVIVSHHDHRATPASAALETLRDRCFAAGADIAKIACLSRGLRDNARLLGLLDDPRPTIVIGMGTRGTMTRIAAPLLGSPFTFAAPARGAGTAAGQLEARALISAWKAIRHV